MLILYKLSIFFFVCFLFVDGMAQQFQGSWTGNLKVQGTDLPLIFTISKPDATFVATLTSPKQSPTPIPVDSTRVDGDTITLKLAGLQIEYKGVFEKNMIRGTFSQGGSSFPLVLEKKHIKKK